MAAARNKGRNADAGTSSAAGDASTDSPAGATLPELIVNPRTPVTTGVPRWRQIEILKERRALREQLDDFDNELDLDEEVFGFDAETDRYFRGSGEEDEEELDEAAGDEDPDDEEFYDD